MIPEYIAEIADLIHAGWHNLGFREQREILMAARRVYDAGYRKQ